MSRRARFPVRIVFLLATALLAAACGGTTAEPTTGGAPSPENDLPTPVNASAALLRLTDLPAGWVIEESTDDDEDEDETACADSTDSATVESKTFTKELARAANTLDVYDTAAEATADFALFRDQKFLDCFRQELADELAQSDDGDPVKITDVAFAPLVTPRWGEDTVAIRITLNVGYAAGSVQGIFDVVIIRLGRILGAYMFSDINQPFDDTLRNIIISVTSGRITV